MDHLGPLSISATRTLIRAQSLSCHMSLICRMLVAISRSATGADWVGSPRVGCGIGTSRQECINALAHGLQLLLGVASDVRIVAGTPVMRCSIRMELR